MNQQSSNDFPVLTDVIAEGVPDPMASMATQVYVSHVDVLHDDPAEAAAALQLEQLQQIQESLSERLIAELSVQVPVLIEAALREHLPQALGARLQAEILTALTNALPIAAQAAAGELSGRLAYEVGELLEQRLQDEVRRAVADEIARLAYPAS